MTLADVRREIAKRGSAESLTKAVMGAIMTAETGPQRLSAFVSFDFDAAAAAAAVVDGLLADGKQLPLAGIPVAIKDNLCTSDHTTTCASRILANFKAPYDATVVKRLREAGAIIVAKANLDEFAMGSTTESSVFGRTRNPHDLQRVTGGSSGGSAAAVAAGIVPVSLGTDTAGSVRQPAALCGVVGFKPSYGRVSRYGLIAYASSLDTVGILTNNVADVAEVLRVIAGVDAFDSTSVDRALEPVPEPSLRGRNIGVPREYFPDDLHPGVKEKCQRAIAAMREAGAMIHDVQLPHTRFGIPAYYAISTVEACSNLARYDGVRYGVRAQDARSAAQVYERTRTLGFGTEVKRRILLGLHMLSETGRPSLQRAQRAAALITQELETTFASGIDFLFTPTAAAPAFKAGEKTDPYEVYLSDMFTVAANLAGIPAISVPIGKVDRLPVGGQLMAAKWQESELLGCAGGLETALK